MVNDSAWLSGDSEFGADSTNCLYVILLNHNYHFLKSLTSTNGLLDLCELESMEHCTLFFI